MKSSNFTFIDLFAGIGGFRIGLERVGGHCVAFSEIDKKAIETYEKNFKTEGELKLGDITQCQNFPKADAIVGGVPCQSWSIAGKNRGFDDERGQLWFDSIRAVKQVQPKFFIFENVKGLSDPRNKESLDFIIQSFKKLNYQVSYQVLNAFDFGLPQNRERIFIVGIRNDLKTKDLFQFPSPQKNKPKLHEFIEGLQLQDHQPVVKKFDAKTLFGSDKVPASRNKFQKQDELNSFFVFCDTRNGHSTIHSWDLIQTSDQEKSICMAILKNRRKSKYGLRDGNPMSLKDIAELVPKTQLKDLKGLVDKNILRKTTDGKFDLVNSKNSSGINDIYRVYLPESEVFSTLTATGTKDYISLRTIPQLPPQKYRDYFIKNVIRKKQFRQISSREAARLQGFPEKFIVHPSYQYAIKQFGNAVPVNVIQALGQQILSVLNLTEKTQKVSKKSRQMVMDL